MLKGSFGDTCRLALNLNSWFVLERHSTQGRSGHRPHVTSVKVLSHTQREDEEKSGTRHVTPPADRWCWFLLTLEKKIGFGVLQSIAPIWVRQRYSPKLYPPQTVQLFNKIYSVFFLYRNIHLWVSLKCCSPYLLHWGLVPVVSTVGTDEDWGRRGCCWNSGSDTVLTSTADTSCSKDTPTQQNSWRLDPSLCLSCSLPPPPLFPLQHSSLHFPPRPGWDTRRRAQQYTLAATHCHKTRDKKSHEWTEATS